MDDELYEAMSDYAESCVRQGYFDGDDNFRYWWKESKSYCQKRGVSYQEASGTWEMVWEDYS